MYNQPNSNSGPPPGFRPPAGPPPMGANPAAFPFGAPPPQSQPGPSGPGNANIRPGFAAAPPGPAPIRPGFPGGLPGSGAMMPPPGSQPMYAGGQQPYPPNNAGPGAAMPPAGVRPMMPPPPGSLGGHGAPPPMRPPGSLPPAAAAAAAPGGAVPPPGSLPASSGPMPPPGARPAPQPGNFPPPGAGPYTGAPMPLGPGGPGGPGQMQPPSAGGFAPGSAQGSGPRPSFPPAGGPGSVPPGPGYGQGPASGAPPTGFHGAAAGHLGPDQAAHQMQGMSLAAGGEVHNAPPSTLAPLKPGFEAQPLEGISTTFAPGYGSAPVTAATTKRPQRVYNTGDASSQSGAAAPAAGAGPGSLPAAHGSMGVQQQGVNPSMFNPGNAQQQQQQQQPQQQQYQQQQYQQQQQQQRPSNPSAGPGYPQGVPGTGPGVPRPQPPPGQDMNANANANANAQSRPRIDPNQIPSPVIVQEADQAVHEGKPYSTRSRTNPPLASTDFVAIDDGNCSPRFIRMTVNQIPTTDELMNNSHIPLAAVIQPFALQVYGETPLYLVDHGEEGPVRCNRCKGYMNAGVMFTDGGRRFVCNLCGFENEVRADYFANLDMSGRRIDMDQRPELLYGAVEFVAPKDYSNRPAKPASFLFLLDVSWHALQSGSLAVAAKAIAEAIDSFPVDETGVTPCRIGILAFDRSINFFNLSPKLSQAQMMVVSEISDIFLPLAEGLLVNCKESKEVIVNLLEQIPKLFESNRANEPAFGAAIQAGLAALKETGGRLVVVSTALPTFGPGALKPREEQGVLGTEKERQLFTPQDNFYRKLAADCCTVGVSVDLLVPTNTYVDLASVGVLATVTGGNTFFYPNFDVNRDGQRLASDIRSIVSRPFGYDCLMRVRCSTGLKVMDHFGNYYMKNSTDLELGSMDSEKAFTVLFKHEGKLEENSDVAIQCAVLYTTAFGQRRIRVLTALLPTSNTLANVFRFSDMDATVNVLAKQAVAQILNVKLETLQNQFTEKCVKILHAYRKYCASSSSAGQLILPESLKLFPLYALALMKTDAFRSGNTQFLPSDFRVYAMRLLNSLGVPATIPLFYPRVLPLHNLQQKHGVVDERGHVCLPQPIRASYERLEDAGIYLVETGLMMIIWLGRAVSSELLQSIFGVPYLDQVDLKLGGLPSLDNATSKKVIAIVSHIYSQRGRFLQFVLVRQNHPSENIFFQYMTEDKYSDKANYVDYLCHVHRLIQNEMNA